MDSFRPGGTWDLLCLPCLHFTSLPYPNSPAIPPAPWTQKLLLRVFLRMETGMWCSSQLKSALSDPTSTLSSAMEKAAGTQHPLHLLNMQMPGNGNTASSWPQQVSAKADCWRVRKLGWMGAELPAEVNRGWAPRRDLEPQLPTPGLPASSWRHPPH